MDYLEEDLEEQQYEIDEEDKYQQKIDFIMEKGKKELTEKYQFAMIIGLDNANTFDKWVNYQDLERLAQFVIVPRAGIERDMNINWYIQKPHIFLNNQTNIIEISSSEIRELFNKDSIVKLEKLLNYLDHDVYKYILTNKLYKNEN